MDSEVFLALKNEVMQMMDEVPTTWLIAEVS